MYRCLSYFNFSHLSCFPCGCITHHTSSSSNFNQNVFTELFLLFNLAGNELMSLQNALLIEYIMCIVGSKSVYNITLFITLVCAHLYKYLVLLHHTQRTWQEMWDISVSACVCIVPPILGGNELTHIQCNAVCVITVASYFLSIIPKCHSMLHDTLSTSWGV